MIWIHSYQMAIVVSVIFLWDSLRGKRSVLLTKYSGSACFENSCGTPVRQTWGRKPGVMAEGRSGLCAVPH